jgi:hypothetical protein
MKVRDNDPFFTVDIPVLRIRPCTPPEAARRTERWNRSRTRSLRRRLETAAKTDRRTNTAATAAGRNSQPELPPWREVATAWQRLRATFDGLFLSDEEEEHARVAFHRKT